MRSFNEISWSDFYTNYASELKGEIESQEKEYILKIDEEEYKNYLIGKYRLEPLEVGPTSEDIPEPTTSKEFVEDRRRNTTHQVEVYKFTIVYRFRGSPILFRVRPETWVMTSYEINVNEKNSTVYFSFKLYNKDHQEFTRKKSECYSAAFTNIDNINKNAQSWNERLERLVSSSFDAIKNKYLEENKFFEAINVKVNKNTKSIFTIPTIKKIIVPPTVSKKHNLVSQPSMSEEMYKDVLKVIYDAGKSMERKPALYQDKDEEGLRDQFLFILETRYEGTTATGETFNRSGKTDILLKYAEDGSNLFVAECKFWHGASNLREAINQLFDRYLTWSDSKAALILFVKITGFTKVLETIKSEVEKHPYYLRYIRDRRETSFFYKFHLPQDRDKEVYFEVMAFHYDK